VNRRGGPALVPSSDAPRVHPSADVEPGAVLGARTIVWRGAHVMPDARVGRDCVLGQGCFVASGARIGDGCRIQNHVSVYGGVVLGDDVFVGPSAVFTNVRRPRARYPHKPSFETTTVGRGATIGANATIVCGARIGEYAFIGAGAVVTRDVPAHALVTGSPARIQGLICACGETVWRTGAGDESKPCSKCGIGPGAAPESRRKPSAKAGPRRAKTRPPRNS
jgi:UDP-2-acetamido-3-amino-2,3-dideoxy-glucuronate N-acetyltransferase